MFGLFKDKKGALFQAYSLPISLSLSFSLLPCSKQGHRALALFPYTIIVRIFILYSVADILVRVQLVARCRFYLVVPVL